jgi:hypothetical protein
VLLPLMEVRPGWSDGAVAGSGSGTAEGDSSASEGERGMRAGGVGVERPTACGPVVLMVMGRAGGVNGGRRRVAACGPVAVASDKTAHRARGWGRGAWPKEEERETKRRKG